MNRLEPIYSLPISTFISIDYQLIENETQSVTGRGNSRVSRALSVLLNNKFKGIKFNCFPLKICKSLRLRCCHGLSAMVFEAQNNKLGRRRRGGYDPCYSDHTNAYFNRIVVQRALNVYSRPMQINDNSHVKWITCNNSLRPKYLDVQ
ncbi:hypothetical protein CASFOL_038929 [Castilleja foliolosa]|uniref:Uncharacterized protein n=1 Tax=Castilleja foliolosa TaxID=1961234 RepID=A0ABD3BIT4_9LAMI